MLPRVICMYTYPICYSQDCLKPLKNGANPTSKELQGCFQRGFGARLKGFQVDVRQA